MAKLLCGTGKCNKVIDVSISDQNLQHKCTNCNTIFCSEKHQKEHTCEFTIKEMQEIGQYYKIWTLTIILLFVLFVKLILSKQDSTTNLFRILLNLVKWCCSHADVFVWRLILLQDGLRGLWIVIDTIFLAQSYLNFLKVLLLLEMQTMKT